MPRVKTKEKEVAIHKAAISLMNNQGYHGLKMSELAKEAKIATGTLYIYYQDKVSLLNGVYQATKHELYGVLNDPLHISNDYKQSFENMYKAFFKYNTSYPEKMTFVEQFAYSGLIRGDIRHEAANLSEPLDRFLLEGQRLKLLQSMPVAWQKSMIMGSMYYLIEMLTSERAEINDKVINTACKAAWKMLSK